MALETFNKVILKKDEIETIITYQVLQPQSVLYQMENPAFLLLALISMFV